MTEKTTRQIENLKNQTIGVEVEMNSITRKDAAKIAAEFFGTGRYQDTAYRNGCALRAEVTSAAGGRSRNLASGAGVIAGRAGKVDIVAAVQLQIQRGLDAAGRDRLYASGGGRAVPFERILLRRIVRGDGQRCSGGERDRDRACRVVAGEGADGGQRSFQLCPCDTVVPGAVINDQQIVICDGIGLCQLCYGFDSQFYPPLC